MPEPEPRACAAPGCDEAGEYRAPLTNTGKRGWQYFCLDHVRAFNSAYNYMDGADIDAIRAASAAPGWERRTRPFASNAYAGAFSDPLGAMKSRFGADVFDAPASRGGVILGAKDIAALKTLDLGEKASWADIRSRYKSRVRALHPDANGGDRSQEAELRRAIDAFNQLRDSPAFGRKTKPEQER